MKLYTGPPKFELGRVEFASGGPGGPPVSKVNVEPWNTMLPGCVISLFEVKKYGHNFWFIENGISYK